MATNLRDRGYSSSMDGYNSTKKTTTTKQNLTAKGYPSAASKSSTGLNLTQKGYPDSTSGYYGVTTPTNTVRNTGAVRSTGSSSGYSNQSYNQSYNPSEDAYYAMLAAYQRQQDEELRRQQEEILQRQQEEQRRQEEEQRRRLEEMRAAARAAYDRGMNSLNEAYNSHMNSLTSNLDQTKSQLSGSYDRSKQSINADAEASLKQAYINKMLSQRNLGQQMSALGLNGGATETTLASMLNNYGNARNNINTTANNNLSNLEGTYNDNLSQAIQAYNSAVADANSQKTQQVMALENALANNEIAALGDYQSLLQRGTDNYNNLLNTTLSNIAKYTYDPTRAENAVRAMAYQQSAPMASGSNYNVMQELMNAQQGTGQSGSTVSLVNPAMNNNYLAAILAQLSK